MPLLKPLPPWLASAIVGADNPGFRVTTEGFGVLERDGRVVWLGVQTEKIKLEMKLDCDFHMRCCTINAIERFEDLMCPVCHSDEDLIAVQRRHPSSYERGFYIGMQELGLGERLRAQEQVGGWGGLVDFVDRVSGSSFQVDGAPHMMKRMHGVPVSAQLQNDVKMCMHAMREKRVLVRVHYLDVRSGSGMHLAAEIMQQAAGGMTGPLLVLSSSFNLSHPTNTAKVPMQLRLLSALTDALRAEGLEFSMYSDAHKQIWIKPTPSM